MSLSITHAFVSSKPDGNDDTLVRPSSWNANHVITGFSNNVVNTVSTSGAPVFDCNLGNIQFFTTSENFSPTFINVTHGTTITLVILQDSGAPRVITWPGNVFGGITLGSTPNQYSIQEFMSVDGTNLLAKTVGFTVAT